MILEWDRLNMAWQKWTGIGLIGLSGVWFACIFVIPFLALSIEIKAVLEAIFLALMEGSFWIGSLIIGKQVLSRYWRSIKNLFRPTDRMKKAKESVTDYNEDNK